MALMASALSSILYILSRVDVIDVKMDLHICILPWLNKQSTSTEEVSESTTECSWIVILSTLVRIRQSVICLNNLLELLMQDERFGLSEKNVGEVLNIRKFIGCAPEQTTDFLENYAKPIISKNEKLLGMKAEINV